MPVFVILWYAVMWLGWCGLVNWFQSELSAALIKSISSWVWHNQQNLNPQCAAGAADKHARPPEPSPDATVNPQTDSFCRHTRLSGRVIFFKRRLHVDTLILLTISEWRFGVLFFPVHHWLSGCQAHPLPGKALTLLLLMDNNEPLWCWPQLNMLCSVTTHLAAI